MYKCVGEMNFNGEKKKKTMKNNGNNILIGPNVY